MMGHDYLGFGCNDANHNDGLGVNVPPDLGSGRNFPPDQVGGEVLEALSLSAVQVGSAYGGEMRTLMNSVQGPCPHLPPCAVLCLSLSCFRSLHASGAAVVGCCCTSSVAVTGWPWWDPAAGPLWL